MSVRAKFSVESVVLFAGDSKKVNLRAVANKDGVPENKWFAKYTPSGTIEMTVDNPPASDQFQPGKVFYVDFTEAEQ